MSIFADVPVEIVKKVRAGKYSLDEFISMSLTTSDFFEKILRHIIASSRADTLAHIMSTGFRPGVCDIKLTIQHEKPGFLDILCKNANSTDLSQVLPFATTQVTPIYTEILLKNGADPNFDGGRAFFDATELGRLDIMKVLYKHGTKLRADFFNAACYWGHNEAAYWLHLNGLSGYETIEFEQYKAQQDLKRLHAQRKIYFWYMERLCRNREFQLRQAAKSYDSLYPEEQTV